VGWGGEVRARKGREEGGEGHEGLALPPRGKILSTLLL